MLGTRQDNYCWPCKTFWDTRVAYAGIRQEDTRIPDIPGIAAFINTWHDWHRGYRILRHEDDSEDREELEGQPLETVEIGRLPLPNPGISQSHPDAIWWVMPNEPVSEFVPDESDEEFYVPEEDRLFDSEPEEPNEQHAATVQQRNTASASDADASEPSPEQADLSALNQGQLQELADIIQRLNGMTRGLEWVSSRLHPFIEALPHRSEGDSGLLQLQNRIGDVHSLLEDQARWITNTVRLWQSQVSEAQNPAMPHASTAARERQRQIYTRVFGTAEDVQQPDYISPLSSMFNRHWERFRAVEEQRRTQANGSIQGRETRNQEQFATWNSYTQPRSGIPETHQNGSQVSSQIGDPPLSEAILETMQNAVNSLRRSNGSAPRENPGGALDSLLPPPDEALTEDQMFIKLQCTVCLEQVADIALVPCGITYLSKT